jgi:hypothetical protein
MDYALYRSPWVAGHHTSAIMPAFGAPTGLRGRIGIMAPRATTIPIPVRP